MEKIILIDENPELEKNELRVLNNQKKVKVKVIQDGQETIEKLMFLSEKAIRQLTGSPEEVKVKTEDVKVYVSTSSTTKPKKNPSADGKKKKKKFFS